MNFYVLAEQVVKVYEMGAVVFKDVFKLRDKYGLDTWAFEIERHGGKGDNKTSYSILPEQRLDDTMRREIAQLELPRSREGAEPYGHQRGRGPELRLVREQAGRPESSGTR